MIEHFTFKVTLKVELTQKETNELNEKLKNHIKENEKKVSSELFIDKIAELEDRSKRNNLRFEGFEEKENESWEESESKVKCFIKEKLNIKHDIQIERAHRTGKQKESGQKKRRTIDVKFLNYKDKEKILDHYKRLKLWNERIYLNDDYSERTIEKRKILFAKAKELRSSGKYAKVVYDKLITRD
ncbi:uncharacterized protein LOC136075841 [Hydra vulgaris]|uniref:Uncharacterized protein LOC136075841 n=1 Tax=Hydra vulgaris TaxID=6087 RepID=A0ABM4B8Y7_HYDVU